MVHSFHSILTNSILIISVECRLMKISSCTQSVKISHWWTKTLQLELHDTCSIKLVLHVCCPLYVCRNLCVQDLISVSPLRLSENCVDAVDTIIASLPGLFKVH